MDRGAWQATVHGVTRVGDDLATKPPPTTIHLYKSRPTHLVVRFVHCTMVPSWGGG